MMAVETPTAVEPFSALMTQQGAHPLAGDRQAAFARYAAKGLPTTRDEAWKYTSLAPLARLTLTRATAGGTVAPSTLRDLCFGDTDFTEVVFIDGRFSSAMSNTATLPDGVFAGAFSAAPPSVIAAARERLAAPSCEAPLDALNLALAEDGGLVFVPRDVRVARPIHLVFVTTRSDAPTAAHLRNAVLVEAGASVTVIESYVTEDAGVYLTHSVTDVLAAEGARVDHIKVAREGREAWHLGAVRAQLAGHAELNTFTVSTGGGVVRNELTAPMTEPETTCRALGLFLLDGAQHCDNHLFIDHAAPRCASEQVFKGILDGTSHGVFSGRVHVAVDAQKTDAQQSCKNLLLSDDAQISTRPQLEIHADDVKCSHGVAIGSLDETQYYYLRARGIGPVEAREILTYAFASELLGRIEVPAVRADIERRISSAVAADIAALTGDA